MKKDYEYYIADALTKIGGGIFAGSTVAFYLNPSVFEKSMSEYWILIALGVASMVVGEYFIWKISNE